MSTDPNPHAKIDVFQRYGVTSSSLTACGCAGMWMAPGSAPVMGAAVNTNFYGNTNACSNKCGMCFELTSTGGAPDRYGPSAGQPKDSITVMVVDACPAESNRAFCTAPNEAAKKMVHFDLAVPDRLANGPNSWGELISILPHVD